MSIYLSIIKSIDSIYAFHLKTTAIWIRNVS